MIRPDVVIISFFRKQIIPRGLDFRQPLIPGSLAVASHNREHSACHSASPAGCRVNRDLKPGLPGKLLQRTHVCFPFLSGSSAHMAILVLNLYHRNRSVVGQQKSPGLFCDFPVKFPNKTKIFRIIGPCHQLSFFLLFHQPVRKSSVSNLSMCPRSDSQNAVKAAILDGLKKPPKITVSRKIPFSFYLFVMNPDGIGRHQVNSAGFHLIQLFLPSFAGNPAVMNLSHQRKPGNIIQCQELRCIR